MLRRTSIGWLFDQLRINESNDGASVLSKILKIDSNENYLKNYHYRATLTW